MRRCSSSACTRAWNASVSVWHLQPHGPREQRGDAAAGAVLCPQHNGWLSLALPGRALELAVCAAIGEGRCSAARSTVSTQGVLRMCWVLKLPQRKFMLPLAG